MTAKDIYTKSLNEIVAESHRLFDVKDQIYESAWLESDIDDICAWIKGKVAAIKSGQHDESREEGLADIVNYCIFGWYITKHGQK
jgi:hypothetical protein